jgi:hypothetical protein
MYYHHVAITAFEVFVGGLTQKADSHVTYEFAAYECGEADERYLT